VENDSHAISFQHDVCLPLYEQPPFPLAADVRISSTSLLDPSTSTAPGSLTMPAASCCVLLMAIMTCFSIC